MIPLRLPLAALTLAALVIGCEAALPAAAPTPRALPAATLAATRPAVPATATPTAQPTATAGPDYRATVVAGEAAESRATSDQARRDDAAQREQAATVWAIQVTYAAVSIQGTALAQTNAGRATAQAANATGTALVDARAGALRATADADGVTAQARQTATAEARVQAERERVRDQWAGVLWLGVFALAGGLASLGLTALAARLGLWVMREAATIEADRAAGTVVAAGHGVWNVRTGRNGRPLPAQPLPVPSTSRGPARPTQTPVAPRVSVEDVNGQPAAVLRAAAIPDGAAEGLALLDDAIALREAEGDDADWSRLPGSRELVEAGYEWDSVKWGRVTDSFTPWIKKRQGAGTVLCRPDYRDLRRFRDAWAAGIVQPGKPTTPPGVEVGTLKIPVASG